MSSIIKPDSVLIGVQERGELTNQNARVWEANLGEMKIGVNLGDITIAPTESVVCPTTPWLEIGDGAVENAIEEAHGGNLSYIGKRIVEIIHNNSNRMPSEEEVSEFIKLTGLPKVEDQKIQQLFNLLKDRRQHSNSVKFGTCLPISSGKMVRTGIKSIILTAATPEIKAYSVQDIALITRNSIVNSTLINSSSLTVPAIGTGVAAAFGFGISITDCIQGFLMGVLQSYQSGVNIERVDFNIYARPSLENANQVNISMLAAAQKLEI